MFAWLKGKKGGEGNEIIVPKDKTFVLFVCTANLSRSPMAEAMLRYEIQDWDEVFVGSCGTKSVAGFLPTPEALTVLQTNGYPTEGLVTHCITPTVVERADHIFVMGSVHFQGIIQKFPKAAEKTHLIRDLSGDEDERGMEVPDPHEKPLDAYLDVYEMFAKLIPRVADFVIDGPTEDWLEWYDFYRRSNTAIGR
jgi:protein-tyrosine-phosphatase